RPQPDDAGFPVRRIGFGRRAAGHVAGGIGALRHPGSDGLPLPRGHFGLRRSAAVRHRRPDGVVLPAGQSGGGGAGGAEIVGRPGAPAKGDRRSPPSSGAPFFPGTVSDVFSRHAEGSRRARTLKRRSRLDVALAGIAFPRRCAPDSLPPVGIAFSGIAPAVFPPPGIPSPRTAPAGVAPAGHTCLTMFPRLRVSGVTLPYRSGKTVPLLRRRRNRCAPARSRAGTTAPS